MNGEIPQKGKHGPARRSSPRRPSHNRFLSRNRAMQDALATLERIAGGDLNILLVGEQGTGKEWAAHHLHLNRRGDSSPFTVVDCHAVSPEELETVLFGREVLDHDRVEIRKGEFEEASGGTILLKDIGPLPSHIQVKIARVMETQNLRRVGGEEDIPVNLHFVATLIEPVHQLDPMDVLRPELYYRITPSIIRIPPLRERTEDIPTLAESLLEELSHHHRTDLHGISREALSLCSAYPWPGNVRQLKSTLEYAYVMAEGKTILPDHLPTHLREQARSAESGRY
jgi:DNA-binding NtrC family response regulator